jgi:hypothetical protein
MEKFTIRSPYSEASLYARWTAYAPAGKSAGSRAPAGHYRHARLADADDVAARASEDWDRRFAARTGSRRDFADELRARLDRWAAGADIRHAGVEHREFRSEVAIRIGARLEDWVEAGGPEDAAAPEGAA